MKKLFVVNIIQIIVAVLMIVLLFVPMDQNTGSGAGFFNTIFFGGLQPVLLSSPYFVGLVIYPWAAILFGLYTILKCIRNIKISKSENAKLPKTAHVKFLFLLFVVGVWGFFPTFLIYGSGEGNIPAIIMAACIFIAPSILLMIVNSINKIIFKKIAANN